MRESYREGRASHPGPEPCEGSREAALEALDRGIGRLGMELRNLAFRGADGVRQSGRQQRAYTLTQVWRGPAESKTLCMPRNSMRENREAPPSPVVVGRAGGRTR
jgi:hypothetical protein